MERAEWERRAAAHAARVDTLVAPHLARRATGAAHPVHDFLFTYYFRPGACAAGTRGRGTGLLDAAGPRPREGVRRRGGQAAHVASQRPLVESRDRLLSATATRPAHLGCFGMHEWAMVYRTPEGEIRHSAWPLRLARGHGSGSSSRTGVRCCALRRVPVLHAPARPLNMLSRPAIDRRGARAAGLPARQHGPLQVGVQADAADRQRAGRRLLRAGPRHQAARHAGQRRTTSPPSGSSRSPWRQPTARRSTPPRSAGSPSEGPRSGRGWSRRASGCSRSERLIEVRATGRGQSDWSRSERLVEVRAASRVRRRGGRGAHRLVVARRAGGPRGPRRYAGFTLLLPGGDRV